MFPFTIYPHQLLALSVNVSVIDQNAIVRGGEVSAREGSISAYVFGDRNWFAGQLQLFSIEGLGQQCPFTREEQIATISSPRRHVYRVRVGPKQTLLEWSVNCSDVNSACLLTAALNEIEKVTIIR